MSTSNINEITSRINLVRTKDVHKTVNKYILLVDREYFIVSLQSQFVQSQSLRYMTIINKILCLIIVSL